MADLGKVGITYDENGYVAETQYEPLTVLKYTDGGTYMSILPTLGHLPTDTNYWACMVPPTEASSIGYTPIAGGVITNTNVQDALEQADSLKVSTNKIANNLTTGGAGYVLDARQGKALNESLSTKVDAVPANLGFTWSATGSKEVSSLRIGNQVNIRGYVWCSVGSTYPLTVASIGDHKPVGQSAISVSIVSSGSSTYPGQIAFAEILPSGNVVIKTAPEQDAYCFFDFNYISG